MLLLARCVDDAQPLVSRVVHDYMEEDRTIGNLAEQGSRTGFVDVPGPSVTDGIGCALKAAYDFRSQHIPSDMLCLLAELE